MNDALHPCFGFEIFGLCNYDPSGPASTYFSVGDAIAALAFTLAVQQFLKPIFIFRLNARGISLFWLYGLVFCGFLSAMIAAVLPSLPIDRELPFAYPIVWEIIGASLFAISYGLLAFGSIWPLRIKEGQVPKFVKAAAGYLAEREEKDYVDLGREILRNLPELMNKASFIDHRWQRISAFYQFTHRKKIEDAAYASSLLRIMSDSRFCRTLIDGCPWLVDSTIRTIAEKQMTTSSAERFIQEISVQALQSDSGIMAREMGYQGFSHAPVLSESLFSNFHILQTFRPLSWLNLRNDQPLERGYLQRLGAACEAQMFFCSV